MLLNNRYFTENNTINFNNFITEIEYQLKIKLSAQPI